MKLINFIKKYKWVLVILTIVIIMLIISNGQKNSNDLPVSLKTQITPTIVNKNQIINPANVQPEETLDINPDYPIQQVLPYIGDGFIVDSYLAPFVLEVKVKNKSDISKAEPLLKKWLLEYESTPGENKITWKYGE